MDDTSPALENCTFVRDIIPFYYNLPDPFLPANCQSDTNQARDTSHPPSSQIVSLPS